MPVNFTKEAHVLTVHGVQLGDDSNIESDTLIDKLISKSLSRNHLDRHYRVKPFLYENINDEAQALISQLSSIITKGNPVVGKALKTLIDIMGDVVTASLDTSTAGLIRRNLKQHILHSYESGNQLVVVSHSLGTVYALDVVNELMKETRYFKGDDVTSWPVQGLITMGSPLGLDLNIAGLKLFDKRNISQLENAQYSAFPWHNYFNRLDPVVSGQVFGKPVDFIGAKGPLEKRYGDDTKGANWLLKGQAITSGKQWVLAHTSYWKNPKIGDRLVDLLWG